MKSEFTFILLSGPSLWPASAALRKKLPLHLSQWGSPASRAETWQQISRFVQIKKKRHQCLPWKTPKLETSLLDSAIAGSKKDITLRPSEASHVVALIFCLVFEKNIHGFSLGSIHSLTFSSRILREHVATKLQTKVVNWRGWQNDVLPSSFNLERDPVFYIWIRCHLFEKDEILIPQIKNCDSSQIGIWHVLHLGNARPPKKSKRDRKQVACKLCVTVSWYEFQNAYSNTFR